MRRYIHDRTMAHQWRILAAAAAMIVSIAPNARAQGAGGSDIGTIAENILNYMGGPAGGFISAAAMMITALLWGIGILSGRHAVETTGAVALAWGASYLIRTTIGWA